MKTITLDGQKIRVFEKGEIVYMGLRNDNGVLYFLKYRVRRYNIEMPVWKSVHIRYWFREAYCTESWTENMMCNYVGLFTEVEYKRLEAIKQQAMKKLEATKKRLTKTERYILGY
jgi:hypothetical protein